jgi:hypothetical protein
MTDREKRKGRSLVAPKADYEIGYGKPPVASRFKPGSIRQSVRSQEGHQKIHRVASTQR